MAYMWSRTRLGSRDPAQRGHGVLFLDGDFPGSRRAPAAAGAERDPGYPNACPSDCRSESISPKAAVTFLPFFFCTLEAGVRAANCEGPPKKRGRMGASIGREPRGGAGGAAGNHRAPDDRNNFGPPSKGVLGVSLVLES